MKIRNITVGIVVIGVILFGINDIIHAMKIKRDFYLGRLTSRVGAIWISPRNTIQPTWGCETRGSTSAR